MYVPQYGRLYGKCNQVKGENPGGVTSPKFRILNFSMPGDHRTFALYGLAARLREFVERVIPRHRGRQEVRHRVHVAPLFWKSTEYTPGQHQHALGAIH